MLDSLANRTGLSRQSIDQLLDDVPAPTPPEVTTPAAPEQRRSTQKLTAKLPGSHRDPLLFALAMLLFNPRGAATGPANINNSEDSAAATLLNNTIALLRKRPDSSTAMLLGHWYGQPEYEVMTEALKTIELLGTELNDEKAEAAFFDTLAHLETQKSTQVLRNHVDKLRSGNEVDKPASPNYPELSETDKQQLLAIQQLLKQKHRL